MVTSCPRRWRRPVLNGGSRYAIRKVASSSARTTSRQSPRTTRSGADASAGIVVAADELQREVQRSRRPRLHAQPSTGILREAGGAAHDGPVRRVPDADERISRPRHVELDVAAVDED